MIGHDSQQISAWLANYGRPLLVSHRSPDGDAIGGVFGLAQVIRQGGAEPLIALYEPPPARYAFLTETAQWYAWDETREVLEKECDAVIILDTCSKSQLEPIGPFLSHAPPILVIDHHITRDDIGTRPDDLRVFDDTASATCLILAEWAAAHGVELKGPVATALFVGIATDTGWFRFSNTDARTMRMAANLVEGGVDIGDLHVRINQNAPVEKLRLTARLLDSLDLHADGRLVVLSIRRKDFADTGADDSMTEDLVNEAMRLESAEAAIMFTETDDGMIRANFRSKRLVDVSRLASRFGGGGHARAAGARMHGAWDQVVPRVIAEAVEMIDALA
jgi:phosphoesterase RecJ-like protein